MAGRRARFLAVASVFFALLALSLFTGSAAAGPSALFAALLQGPGGDSMANQVLWNLRFPRALAAILTGAALALSGLQLQTILRNPLAGPQVLGITSGSTLGIALVLLVGGGVGLSMLGAAALGSALVLALILLVAGRLPGTVSLLVAGLMAGYLVDAVVQVLLHGASAERVQAFVGWTFGSFARLSWDRLPLYAGAVGLGAALAIASLKYLDATLLGDDTARLLGISVRRHRAQVLFGSSLLAAAATVFCGPIGFVGLAVPNLARMLFRTSAHRVLLPASALLGAGLCLLAALLAQLPGTNGLPVSAVTALLGAPVVLWVLLRRRAS